MMLNAVPWRENRLAATRIDRALVRLCEPMDGRFPHRIFGCETTHQIGLWTSHAFRPHGVVHYRACDESVPLNRIHYVPADVEWSAQIEQRGPIRPALYCDFEKDFFREITGLDSDDSPSHLRACHSMSSPMIVQSMSLLVNEMRNPGFSHGVTVDALCRVLLVEISRHFRSHDGDTDDKSRGKLARWQVDRIRDYVETVEGQPIVISDLAAISGLSCSHLRRVFKSTTGISLGSFVDNIRLDRAKSLLREGDKPLKQIAHALGFSSQSTFSTAFQRGAGTSPNLYRQMAAPARSRRTK